MNYFARLWCKLAHNQALTIDSIPWAGLAASIRECQQCGRQWASASAGLSADAFRQWEANQVARNRSTTDGGNHGR